MKKLIKQDITQRLKKLYPNENLECIFYISMKSPIKIKCLSCGTIYQNKQAGNIFRPKKYFCSLCNDTEQWKKTKQKFQKWLKEYSETFILVDNLDNIHNSQDHVKCQCVKCGKIQQNKKIYDYLNGKQCYCVNKGTKKTLDVLQNELGDEYELIGEYVNTDTKMQFKHKKCGQVFSIIPKDLIRYKGFCPKCNYRHSHGEYKIKNILDKIGISYIKEYPVKIQNKVLRFDFFLPEKNIMIQYNGIQHYQSVKFFGGQEKFLKQQEHDKIKSQWCLNNNIKLIIIKYTEPIESRLLEEGVI